jgi:hypothetical protein
MTSASTQDKEIIETTWNDDASNSRNIENEKESEDEEVHLVCLSAYVENIT